MRTPQERTAMQDAFLDAFAVCGNISQSCTVAGIDRKTVYVWREHDAAFLVRFHQAEAEADDSIRQEIRRRAVAGVSEPLVQMGKVVYDEDPETGERRRVTIQKYSDTLLIFLAKSRMPEFRDKVQIDQQTQVSMSHAFTFQDDPEAARLARSLLARVTGYHASVVPEHPALGGPGRAADGADDAGGLGVAGQ